MLVDRSGAWSYVRIPAASYVPDAFTSCNDVTTFKNIHVGPVDTASATLPAPPNPVASLTDPVFLVTGLQVISFRVLTDDVDGLPKLQQKLGLFDPSTDNPGTDFTNVMENVEDLQVAYMYSQDAAAGANGLVWNTGYVDGLGVRHDQTIDILTGPGCGALPAPGCGTHVPFQAGPNFGAAPPPLDITNVIGVRVSVTGRSPLLPLGAQKLTNIDVTGNPGDDGESAFPPGLRGSRRGRSWPGSRNTISSTTIARPRHSCSATGFRGDDESTRQRPRLGDPRSPRPDDRGSRHRVLHVHGGPPVGEHADHEGGLLRGGRGPQARRGSPERSRQSRRADLRRAEPVARPRRPQLARAPRPQGPRRGIRRAACSTLRTFPFPPASGRTARDYFNISIPQPAGVSVADVVTYSLYLRNNVDDAQGTDTVDTDNIVNLVSVGTVQLAAGLVVTKIVEEQLLLTTGGGSTGGQKDVNAGGTNTITGST